MMNIEHLTDLVLRANLDDPIKIGLMKLLRSPSVIIDESLDLVGPILGIYRMRTESLKTRKLPGYNRHAEFVKNLEALVDEKLLGLKVTLLGFEEHGVFVFVDCDQTKILGVIGDPSKLMIMGE